jgi:large subunit ribosomal protein L5
MAAAKEQKGGKGRQKQEQKAAPQAEVISTAEIETPRFSIKYAKEVVPALIKQFGFKNPNQVPRLEKIVVNMGLGAAVANPKIIDAAVEEIRAITGQKPVVTRSKKAIASFKLRAGLPIGVMVTLRGPRMWEFADRLISVSLPRVRDFRGVSRKAFDGKGNYTLGLKEQIIFPEINYDRIDVIKGLNISFVTTAKNDEEGRALLQHLGMPFRSA